ncbi:MAG: BolA/IbaG family iron-sulfur metabolism protein [Simkaniaceae bacterium]|nr:BolA/IbaG family iron-sulfur metabolism protein [Simkaniaceae bacterium]
MENQIKAAILKAIDDAEVHVLDPRCDGVHLEAVVISDTFEGKLPLARQRGIMKALSDLFETGLHALALKTYTKNEWEQHNANE